jgi:hypothetical protein
MMNACENIDLLMRRVADEVAHRRAQITVPRSNFAGPRASSTVDRGTVAATRTAFAAIPPEPVHLNLPKRNRRHDDARLPCKPKADSAYQLKDFFSAEFARVTRENSRELELTVYLLRTHSIPLQDGPSSDGSSELPLRFGIYLPCSVTRGEFPMISHFRSHRLTDASRRSGTRPTKRSSLWRNHKTG